MKKNLPFTIQLRSAVNVLFLTLSLFALSCKKDRVGVPGPVAQKRVSRIEQNNSPVGEFTYDASGRLSEYNSVNYKIKYDYTGNGFSFKSYSYGVLNSELKDVVLADKKLSSFVCQYYSQGQQANAVPTIFEYNPDGKLKSFRDDENNYEFTYSNGDFITLVEKKISTGVIVETSTFEYYQDMPSKFNLPLLDYFFALPVLSESMTGAPNKHLMKKVTSVRGANTYITEFTFEQDANGNVTGYTQVYKKNNDSPVTSLIRIFY